jgi:hypothetical protein
MKRSLIIIAGFLVAAAIGVGIGYLVGRNNPQDRKLAENPAALKQDEARPDWKEWKYPGCVERGFGQVGGGQSGGVKTPMDYHSVMTTPDDYEKVLGFYAEKTGISVLALENGAGAGGGTSGEWFVANDSLLPDEVAQNRPVRVRMFGKRTPTYDLTMFISRANDEKHTHIILAYTKK